jgi:Putative peptidoglycan binding domain
MSTLNSPRFQGSDTLNKCLNGLRTMPPQDGALPETDKEAVKKIQRALVDLGYLLSFDEVDGTFGNRTSTSVSRFKTDRGISPSNGVVGPKTMKALDNEFPPGILSIGLFTPFVITNRLDGDLAGLLDNLMILATLPWANQTAVFALQELSNQNLAGIVRASRASDLKPHVPPEQHSKIDSIAADFLSAAPNTGTIGLTTRFTQSNLTRSHIIFKDEYVDRTILGDEKHLGGMLALSHELMHVRNRILANSLQAEPITATNYVDVALANTLTSTPGNGATNFTRSTFIEEIGCRQLAWEVYQDLVINHAQLMLQAGVISRTAAVSELKTNLQPGQLFRSAIDFAIYGAFFTGYNDNDYMNTLVNSSPSVFNRQVAIWMQTANQLTYHNDAARSDIIRNRLTNEFNTQSPSFATPNMIPAGLISA